MTGLIRPALSPQAKVRQARFDSGFARNHDRAEAPNLSATRKGRCNPLPENPSRNKGFFIDLRSLGGCAEVSLAQFPAKALCARENNVYKD